MEKTPIEITKRKFSDSAKKFDVPTLNKIISTFTGFDKEYKELVDTSATITPISYKDNNVVVLNTDEVMTSIISHGICLSDLSKKLKKEIDIISESLKAYGATKLSEWNTSNNEDVASVKLFNTGGDRSILITVKNAYSIDSNKLTEIKKELGKDFDNTFTTETSWTIKNDKIKDVISLLKNTLGKAGAAFIKEAFIENVSYKVKSRKDFQNLLNSNISEDAKKTLKEAVKQQEPSITYPK